MAKKSADGSAAALAVRVRRADHAAVSRSISLIVDGAPAADSLLKDFFASSGSVQKIGICGAPGVGKSSLSGALIRHFRASGLKVALLAVDPSSPITGGAFLGDRLRIADHSSDSGVFIRSLASRGMVGGLTYSIFGAIHVLEAAGFERILVETVGSGQDEVQIAKVADTVVYVTTPRLGDEIQAMKAGIMEIGDCFVVNKADLSGKDKTLSDIRAALSLGRETGMARGEWDTPVIATSTVTGEGVPELAKALAGHWAYLRGSAEGRRRLQDQNREELSLCLSRRLQRDILERIPAKSIEDLIEHKTDPETLAKKLLKGQP